MLRFVFKTILSVIVSCLVCSFCAHAQSAGSGITVEVIGPEQAPNVVLIPGLSSPGEVWHSTVEELKDRYRFHVVSLPGFAGSEPVQTDKPFLEAMADQIVGYLSSNSIENPILAGHSLGGFLSLYIGAEHPNLPVKIISVDGVPFLPAMTNPYMTEESAQTMADNAKNRYLELSDEQLRAQQKQVIATMVTDSSKQELAIKWSMESDRETVAESVHYLYGTDLRDELSGIKVPILVFGAWKAYENFGVTKQMSHDMYTRQFSEADSVSIKISDSGRHFLMWDDPELITSEFDKFITN